MQRRQEVLIVGAGPVGMLLALELSLHGVKPRLIGRHYRDNVHSRATILWPRTLELLNRHNLDEAIISEGHCFEEMSYYSNMHKVGCMRLSRLSDTSFKFGVTIPQWKTEELLRKAIVSAGIEIEYDTEFIDGSQSDEHVRVSLRTQEKHESTETFKWVIGADGFRSTVRSAFGFSFDGFQLNTKLAITDAEVVGDTATGELAYYMHRTGNLVLAPLGKGIFRVGVSVNAADESKTEVNHAFFESLLRERAGKDLTLGEMKFSGTFNAHVRTASTFRLGRVLLAGDAAHAMSPSGAQGLNTGLQDAVNLGWKLGAVLSGYATSGILETYSEERKAAVRRASQLSTTLARMSLLRSRVSVVPRDFILKWGSASGLLDRYLTYRLAQFDTGGTFGGVLQKSRLLEGDRLSLIWNDDCGQPVLSAVSYNIILWPGSNYSWRLWESFVLAATSRFSSCKIIDLSGRPTGRLRHKLLDDACAVIVRPDGHVAAISKADLAELEQAAARCFVWHGSDTNLPLEVN